MRTSMQNWFATTVTSQVGPEALVADVATTGNLTAPAYIVFNPRSPSQREVWLADVTFTATRFETSVIANRYLAGSAAGSGLTHNEGTEVWSVPLSQNLDDMWDDVDAAVALVAGKADDPHGDAAHSVDYLDTAGDTMTGDLDMGGNAVLSAAAGHTSVASVSGATSIDLNADALTHNLVGNVTYSAINRAAGRRALVRVLSDASIRTLTFPAGWVFVGEKPVDIAANKTGILTVEAFGPNEADIVAAWAVEE